MGLAGNLVRLVLESHDITVPIRTLYPNLDKDRLSA